MIPMANGTEARLALPSQPRPQEGESFTSWIVRLTEENQVNYRSFLRWCLGNGEWRRRDIDLLDPARCRIVGIVGGIVDESVPLQMTLSAWMNLIGPKHDSDRKSWVSSLGMTRFCAECRAEDPTAYLRRIWRLLSVPLCPKHHSLIRNCCFECGKIEPILEFRQSFASNRCRRCGSRYDQRILDTPHDCERLFRFVKDQSRFLETGLLNTRSYGCLGIREFYEVLRFLIRMGNLQLQYGRVPSEEFRTLVDLRLNWRKNEYTACLLIEHSLRLMEDWPRTTALYVRENQTLFNELAQEFGDTLPESLKAFRKVRQGNFRTFEVERLPSPSHIRENAIREAVDNLVRTGKWIGPVTIEMMTGISYKTIMSHPELLLIILEGQDRLRQKHASEVRHAVSVFRRRNIQPTVRAVAAYIGHSPKFIRNSRELLEIIRKASVGGARGFILNSESTSRPYYHRARSGEDPLQVLWNTQRCD